MTFTDGLTLNVGNHTFNIIHHPGHTAPQTSVHVPEEGVVFTGDNVFHKCRSWLQECDPWEWLAALDRHRRARCRDDRPRPWRALRQGLSEGAGADRRELDRLCRALCRARRRRRTKFSRPVAVTAQDPYPIGQRLFMHDERLTGMIVRNLHARILERKAAGK